MCRPYWTLKLIFFCKRGAVVLFKVLGTIAVRVRILIELASSLTCYNVAPRTHAQARFARKPKRGVEVSILEWSLATSWTRQYISEWSDTSDEEEEEEEGPHHGYEDMNRSGQIRPTRRKRRRRRNKNLWIQQHLQNYYVSFDLYTLKIFFFEKTGSLEIIINTKTASNIKRMFWGYIFLYRYTYILGEQKSEV